VPFADRAQLIGHRFLLLAVHPDICLGRVETGDIGRQRRHLKAVELPFATSLLTMIAGLVWRISPPIEGLKAIHHTSPCAVFRSDRASRRPFLFRVGLFLKRADPILDCAEHWSLPVTGSFICGYFGFAKRAPAALPVATLDTGAMDLSR